MNLLIEKKSNNTLTSDNKKNDNDYEESKILVNFNIVYRKYNKFFLFNNQFYSYLKTFNIYVIKNVQIVLDLFTNLKDESLKSIINNIKTRVTIY